MLWIANGYAINKACPLGEKLMNMKRRRPNENPMKLPYPKHEVNNITLFRSSGERFIIQSINVKSNVNYFKACHTNDVFVNQGNGLQCKFHWPKFNRKWLK